MDREKLIQQLNEAYERAANADEQDKAVALDQYRQEVTELFLAVSSDVDRLQAKLLEKQQQAEQVMHIDPLTGLYNQEGFTARANRLTGCADSHTLYRFIYVNVTNFRFYNLVRGREEGNRLLQALADHISRNAYEKICARTGQDNFVFLTHSEDALDKVHTIDQLTEHMAMMIHPDDRQAFMRFFNHADLLLRMREKDDIVLADYFRIRMKNKRYDWKVLRILYLDDTDELIYTVHRSDIVEKYNRVQKDVSGKAK